MVSPSEDRFTNQLDREMKQSREAYASRCSDTVGESILSRGVAQLG